MAIEAKFRLTGHTIPHTPSSAVAAGDVVLIGTIPTIAVDAIAASALGAVMTEGIFDVCKKNEAYTAGDAVYWDVDGDAYQEDAGTGAATRTASEGNLMGYATEDAGATALTVTIHLTAAKRTATIAGAVTATDITGQDSSLGVNGLEAAQGGAMILTGGVSTTTTNAGGAVSVTGGTPGATGVGGAVAVHGGVGGATSGAGGAVTVIGGAGTASGAGAGGAVTVTGGIGGAASGAGGAIAIAGGAGTAGNANGGAVSILAGNAHGSGTDGVMSIGTSNTSGISIGAAEILTQCAGPIQDRSSSAVVATVGGGTTGLIPAGCKLAIVTSDTATKQISLPAASVGDEIEVLVTGAACEMISAVAGHKINEVTVGSTNELALVQDSLYRCKYVATNKWIVTGHTKLGAREAALVPDGL